MEDSDENAADPSHGANEKCACRLCGGSTVPLFNKIVLGRHCVRYHRCETCYCQQTDPPTWLEEAYAIAPNHIDVGAASRTLKNWIGAVTFLEGLNVPRTWPAVDIGAASGLFVRLMRDVGYDFRAQDKYAWPSFASYFQDDPLEPRSPRVVTLFEVLEHLPEPGRFLEKLLGEGPDLVLFTTWFCDDQDMDWIYYLPECGQHVFFYSEHGMREFAAAFGYDMTISHFFMILAKRNRLDEASWRWIERFSLDSLALAAARTTSLVSSVIMGNAFIDKDFDFARKQFAGMIGER
jgi:hypothetical protein